MRTLSEVNHSFNPVAKMEPSQSSRLTKLQVAYLDLAQLVVDLAPDCPDRTRALNSLLDSKFLSTQSVTHSWNQEKKRQ